MGDFMLNDYFTTEDKVLIRLKMHRDKQFHEYKIREGKRKSLTVGMNLVILKINILTFKYNEN